ncbi:hypothetical protein LSAT2_001022 [Lamellibrachia satsuma]|nr:hypothetical protein LSAT2_001022 [Lamellibrachia satsuma]
MIVLATRYSGSGHLKGQETIERHHACVPCTGGRVRRMGTTAHPTATLFKPKPIWLRLRCPRCGCPRRCTILHN